MGEYEKTQRKERRAVQAAAVAWAQNVKVEAAEQQRRRRERVIAEAMQKGPEEMERVLVLLGQREILEDAAIERSFRQVATKLHVAIGVRVNQS